MTTETNASSTEVYAVPTEINASSTEVYATPTETNALPTFMHILPTTTGTSLESIISPLQGLKIVSQFVL